MKKNVEMLRARMARREGLQGTPVGFPGVVGGRMSVSTPEVYARMCKMLRIYVCRTFMMSGVLTAVAMMSMGCVRRTARFTTEPPAARLFLNDRDVGKTPVTVDFTWYGDYDVIYRLEDHRTVKTHVRIDPPWYQIFPLDFFAEVLWPFELHDHHEVPTQQLEPQEPTDEAELIQRALEFRDRALVDDARAKGQ